MKLSAILLASTAAVASASNCDVSIFSGLLGLITKPEFSGCVTDTGYALTTLSVPSDDTIAKICKSTSCKQLITDLEGLVSDHCSQGSVSVLSNLASPIAAKCGWSSDSSASASDSAASSGSNDTTDSLLPVFFFHGLTRNSADGDNLKAALAAQGRDMIALSFASDANSALPLNTQVPLAIEQIRSYVANNTQFQNGYVFVGHSLGGMLARAVTEEMDDHQVDTLISLAGVQNGLFYGPQAADEYPLQVFFQLFGPGTMPDLLDYSAYAANSSTWRGVVQRDFAVALDEHPELQEELAFPNLVRSPVLADFLANNTFLPKINNVKKAETAEEVADQERRKNNFLKVKNAHFFGSPGDGYTSPYQVTVFGHYSEVDTLEEIETKFEDFTMVDMVDTTEYIEDTFGLKTLNERGGLHLHVVPDVPHIAWFMDYPSVANSSHIVEFQTVFEDYISPALP